MSKRRKLVLAVTALCAAFAVAVGFAVQNYALARRYRRLLENSYHHAFVELTTAAGELDSALHKSLYATQGPLRDSLYQQVYAKALAAQSALGELPYGNEDLEQTAAFFARVGDYAAALCRGGCEDPAEVLAGLAAASRKLNASLAALQGELEAGTLDLAQLQRAEKALSQQESGEAPELGGVTFQSVEADFPELPSLVYDGPFSEHMSAQTPRALEGLGEVTQEEALRKAAAFLNCAPGELTALEPGQGVLPTYDFALSGGEGEVEITRQGGMVLCYFLHRATGEAVMTPEEGVEAARRYLDGWGFTGMAPSYHIQREGELTVHFAPVDQGVFCYPDLVKLTIALDDGALLGYEAHGYLYQHHRRDTLSPAVVQETARGEVPDSLTVLAAQLAIIPTAGGTQEVLTWEFKCQAEDESHVLVYVNALTGQQQNILLLLEDETGTLTL